MRLAKVIETTKKINISVKKIIKKQLPNIIISPDKKHNYLKKGRRNMNYHIPNEVELVMKYRSDYDKFDGNLQIDDNFRDSIFSSNNDQSVKFVKFKFKDNIKFPTSGIIKSNSKISDNLVNKSVQINQAKKNSNKTIVKDFLYFKNPISFFKSDKTLQSLVKSSNKSFSSSVDNSKKQRKTSNSSVQNDIIFLSNNKNTEIPDNYEELKTETNLQNNLLLLNEKLVLKESPLDKSRFLSNSIFLNININSPRPSSRHLRSDIESDLQSRASFSIIPKKDEERRASQFSDMNFLIRNSNDAIQKVSLPSSYKRASVLLSHIPKFIPATVKEEEESITSEDISNSIIKAKKKRRKHKRPKSQSITENTIDICNKLLVNQIPREIIEKETNFDKKFLSKLTVQIGQKKPSKLQNDLSIGSILSISEEDEHDNEDANNNHKDKAILNFNFNFNKKEESNNEEVTNPNVSKNQINTSYIKKLSSEEMLSSDKETKKRSLSFLKPSDTSSLSQSKKESYSFSRSKTMRTVNKFETGELINRNAKSIISVDDLNESEIMKPREEKLFNNKVYSLAKIKESLKKIEEDIEKEEDQVESSYKRQATSVRSLKRHSLFSSMIPEENLSRSIKIEEENVEIDSDGNESKSSINSNNLSMLSVNYDAVQGLEVPNSANTKKIENLLLEVILFRKLTLKIVVLFMMIIIGLQLTDIDYVTNFDNSQNTRIDYCMDNVNTLLSNISANSSNMLIVEENILLLNNTLNDCFVNMHGINPNISYPEDLNLTDPYNFIFLNLTTLSIREFISNVSSLDLPDYIVSESYEAFAHHEMQFNLDYTSNFIFIDKSNYVRYFVYINNFITFENLLDILKSIFITFILLGVSFLFGYDLKYKVIEPTIKLINKFRYFFNSSTYDYISLMNLEDVKQEEIIIPKKLGICSAYFDMSIGKRVLGLVALSDNLVSSELNLNFRKEGFSFIGTGLYLDIHFKSGFKYDENILEDLNKVYNIFHTIGYGFCGEIITKELIIWKEKDDLFRLLFNEYCKDINGNNGKVSKLFAYETQQSTAKDSTTPQDVNLAFLSSIEIISNFIIKFPEMMERLNSAGVYINLALFRDDFYFGFLGNDHIVKELLYSQNINKLSSYFKQSINFFPQASLIISSSVYDNLHRDLLLFCYPFDIYKKDLFYKLYSESSFIERQADEDEDLVYDREFNINRVSLMKNQIMEILKYNFDILIELLFSTLHIAKNVNGTIKSLTKLAFHYLIINKYRKVNEILTDMLKELIKQEGFDQIFYMRMRLLKEQIIKKINE